MPFLALDGDFFCKKKLSGVTNQNTIRPTLVYSEFRNRKQED